MTIRTAKDERDSTVWGRTSCCQVDGRQKDSGLLTEKMRAFPQSNLCAQSA